MNISYRLLVLIIIIFSATTLYAQVPNIDSFSPESGPVGTSITIHGSNFSTVPSNNIVYFGATKAAVVSATTTDVTVTVPVGATYAPLTVISGGLFAQSNLSFGITFSGNHIIDGSSFVKSDYTASDPNGVIAADLDGDGKSEIIVTNQYDTTIAIYHNVSAKGSLTPGSFDAPVTLRTENHPTGIAAGDLDGDGKEELVVTNYNNASVSVFHNTGTVGNISFDPKVDLTLDSASGPFNVVIADVNGDGKPDILITTDLENRIWIFQNTSTMGSITLTSFAPKKDVVAGSSPFIQVGDIDGDGKPDIVAANWGNNNVSVLLNVLTPGENIDYTSFSAPFDFSVGNHPFSVSLVDVDGDGKLDAVAPNEDGNSVSVLRNTSTIGNITFESNVDFSTDPGSRFAGVGDLNGDGKPDITVTNRMADNISVLQNQSTTGTIAFAGKIDYATGVKPRSIFAADLDGDNRPDMVVANEGTALSSSNTISVFRNTIDTYHIDASAGSNGAITPSGNLNVNDGDSVLFTLTPATGYHTDSLVVDGAYAGSFSTYTFSNVAANHTISGTFAINKYTISVSPYDHGTVSPDGAVPYDFGSSPVYTLTPDAHYHIDSVIVDGLYIGTTSSHTFSNLSTNHTLRVKFAIDTNPITSSAGSGGTISPSGTIAVGFDSNQLFTIVPNTGYHIFDVTVDGLSVGAVSSYDFLNVIAAHSISASFAIDTFTITASACVNGSIVPSGNVAITYGGSQHFSFVPSTGYHIDSVLVDGVAVDSLTGYTFTNVATNHTIAARFAINHFIVASTSDAHGSITPLGSIDVTYGGNTSFTITPDLGYHIINVLVDGSSVGALPQYDFTGVITNHSIHASFAIDTLNLLATSGAHGSISPSGSLAVLYGSNQAFTITSDVGYHIDTVYVDGANQGAIGSYTFNNVTANHTIHAVFVINQYTIIAASGANGTISPSGSVNVNHGSDQSFTITANTGYHIDSVFVDGVDQGSAASYTFNNVTTSHTIHAAFAINQYTISASAGPDGSISPNGSVNVNHGSDQTFTITANTGYHIDSVLIDGINQGVIGSHTFTNVTANHTIRAVFAINQYMITATSAAHGSINPSGSVNVNHGSDQGFTITANTGYHIDSVLVDGVDQGAIANYTFNNVTANHTIHAVFAINQYTITATAGANGTISPSGAVNVTHGADQSFTVTANTGYHIDSVIVDGVDQGAITSHTFTNVTGNHTIDAKFSIDIFTISASSGANGTITPSGNVPVSNGNNQSFTIAALANYYVDSVVVDGVDQGSLASYTFNNVTANHTIHATFMFTCPTITFTPSSLSDGVINKPFNQSMTAQGGVTPYLYSLSSGTFPTGIVLSSNGILSGTPTDTGNFSFTIGVVDSNSCTGSQSYSLHIGTMPEFSFSVATISFGSVVVGTGKADSLIVANPGSGVLTISSVTTSGNQFTILPANATISPAGNQKFIVTFLPSSPGVKKDTILFVHDAAGSPGSVVLDGHGVAPVFSIVPSSLSFGDVVVGTEQQDSVDVTNAGTSDLVISSVVSDSSQFTVTPHSATIAAGEHQQFVIGFTPASTGVKSGNIIFTHNAGGENRIAVDGAGRITTAIVVHHVFGWDLISTPVLTSNDSVQQEFPSSISSKAYKFDLSGGYSPSYRLERGRGYWTKFASAGEDSIHGYLLLDDSINIVTGWNLIGSISRSVDIGTIVSNPADIVQSHFYGFDGGYHLAPSVDPGKAYWVRANQDGKLLLNSSGVTAKQQPRNNVLEMLDRIKIKDAKGNAQELYFGSEQIDTKTYDRYMLPPAPPKGSFDARFASGRMIEVVAGKETKNAPLLISAESYPVTIAWDITDAGDSKNNAIIVGSKQHTLRGKGSVSISGPEITVRVVISPEQDGQMPAEFSLKQNYPNPFNPTTEIRYAIVEHGLVSLKVYNILGNEIATLVNQVEEPGLKSVVWDAIALPSGVYFYRLTSGLHSDVKKMTLIK